MNEKKTNPSPSPPVDALAVLNPKPDQIVTREQWEWIGSRAAKAPSIDVSDDVHLMPPFASVPMYELRIRCSESPKPVALINADALTQARDAVAELVAADHEYDAASRDWEQATAGDPGDLSEESWRRIADRFEEATMRRIAALDRIGGAR